MIKSSAASCILGRREASNFAITALAMPLWNMRWTVVSRSTRLKRRAWRLPSAAGVPRIFELRAQRGFSVSR